MAKLTPSGKKALLWLHEQGGETIRAGNMSAALNSLSMTGGHQLVTGEWGDFGPRKGRALKWRLTDWGRQMAFELSKKKD